MAKTDLSRPPKEGEKIYVSYTQVYAVVLEPGPEIGTRRGKPVWRVLSDRKGRSHEIEVQRDNRGKLHVSAGGAFHASIKGGSS